MTGKWDIPSWGVAQAQIREAIEFLLEGKTGTDRAEITDELLALVRSIGRGDPPQLESNPLTHRDEYERESWARGAADKVVGGAMRICEPLPTGYQDMLLFEIAKLALWHGANSREAVRKLKNFVDLENIKQPHPKDPPPGRD